MGQFNTSTARKFDWVAHRAKFEQTNISFDDFEENDVVEWFNLLHSSTEDNKYIPFLFLPVNATDTERTLDVSYKKSEITPELLKSLCNNAADYGYNLYMSNSALFNPKRNDKNAYSCDTIIIDLDYYHTEYKNLFLYDFLDKIDFKGFPRPTATVTSGNGVYLIWKLRNNVALGVNSANGMITLLKKKMIELLSEFGADEKCTNASRVFRLIGSRNFKDGAIKESYIIKNNNVVHDIQALLEYFEVEQALYVPKKPKQIKSPNAKQAPSVVFVQSNRSRFSCLSEDRVSDLMKLAELRGYDFGTGLKGDTESIRNEYLFILAVHLFYCYHSETEVFNTLDLINSNFEYQLENKELEDIVASAKRNEKNRAEGKDHYKYKNKTICKKLSITEEEQAHMKQLITPVIRKQRQDDRNEKNNAKRSEERKQKKEEKESTEILRMNCLLNDNIALTEIAKMMGISYSKAKVLKKKVQEIIAQS